MSDPAPESHVTKTGNAANFVWGLPNNINVTTYGRIQSFRKNDTSEKEPLKDAEGCTDGMVYYDKGAESTLEAIIKSADQPTVEIATGVTINSVYYIIEGCEHNWTAGAWAKVTLTLKNYELITAPSSAQTGT